MFCQNCGKKNLEDSVFCSECGFRLDGQATQPKIIPDSDSSLTKPCIKCGTSIPIDSRFCPECKAKQNEAPVLQMQSPNLKKRNKIIGITIVAALGVCLIIGLLSAFIRPTINLNKYFNVSFDGYDSVGKAVIEFDVEEFEKDYEKKLSAMTAKKSSDPSKYLDQEAYFEALLESYDDRSASMIFLSKCIDGELDKSDALSNGEVVTYQWLCNDEYALENYGYKLKYEDVEYIVEGLKEAEVFDPFDGIEVLFNGIAPNGSADVGGEAKNRAAKEFRYNIDKSTGLSNGDKVTVTATMYYDDPVEYCINNYGSIPSPLIKIYTVEGLGSYIQSLHDISEESLKEMQIQAEDVYNANVAQNWGEGEKLKSLTYIGSYLLTNKSSDDYWGAHNILYLVYRAQINNTYSNAGETYNKVNNIYWYIRYDNLLVDPNGVTTVDVADYRRPGDSVTIDSKVSSGWWGTKTWYYYGIVNK